MPKDIKDYTDKELEKAIELHKTAIECYKQIRSKDKEIIQNIVEAEKRIEDHLIKLYKERTRRTDALKRPLSQSV